MKIGFFLGYAPNTHLNKEGLGRYLGTLICSLIEENDIIIACPRWLLKSVQELFNDLQIEEHRINYITNNKTPVIWEIFDSLKNIKRKRKKRRESNLSKYIENITDILISITNIPIFISLLVFSITLVLLLSVPIVIFIFIISTFMSIKRWVRGQGKLCIKTIIKNTSEYLKIGISKNRIFTYAYEKVIESVHINLIKQINKQTSIDIWYSPSVFWPLFTEIKGTKVVNAPDLVTVQFSLHWGNDFPVINSTKKCEKTIEQSDYFIVYSNYIKTELLEKKFGKNKNNISVINHPINDMGKYIFFDNKILAEYNHTLDFTSSFCKYLLGTLRYHTENIQEYITNFDFSDVDFIFYASQNRPHKNLMNLIKAYEYLLRKKYCRIKLFLTCRLSQDKELYDYILNNRLQYDVISFYDISSFQLAALYYCAKLVVNPTLYEGGFPFTFAEGLSVNTPSVMSKIPQVTEILSDENFSDILFDPYNYKDMAEKIEYGLNNSPQILEKELEIYKSMELSSLSKSKGKEYENAFQDFIKKNTNSRDFYVMPV